ncbi:hypothetical protein KJ865_09120, partial [Myxococcota bacterium]|nr:hypothetical protein [Myxococcota bacterium]MBU1611315.1 hypothetical protein [Pseudomonadota bacterium]
FSSEEDDGKITFLAPMSVKAFIARAGKVDLFAQVGFTPFFPSADNVYGAYSYSSGGGLQYWLNDRWTVCASLLYRYLTWDPSYDDESSSAHGLTLGIMLLYHPDMSTRGGTIFIWY